MINKYLETEIRNNLSINEIFENQKVEDLEEIKKIYNQHPTTNILIEFDMGKINKSKLLNMFPYSSKENRRIWDIYVAIQLLKGINCASNISDLLEQEELICNGDLDCLEAIFTKSEEGISNSNGVKKLMSITNTLYRIHFIIRDCENPSLYNAVTTYLDTTPQPIMIYTDNNFKVKKVKMENLEEQNIWDVYNFTVYDGLEAGIKSAKYRTKQKTKVKSYEEV